MEPPTYDDATKALLQRAIAKRRAGQKPTRDEERALVRYQRDEDERSRARHYAAVPKKDWVRWSGRQHKILDDQARRYGLPIAGDAIDLAAFVRRLHDFLAENGHKILRPDTEDDLLGGGDGEKSPALELLRKESWRIKKLERLELEGSLVSREKIHELLAQFAGILRLAGEQLQRQYGGEALEIHHDALADCERLIERSFAAPPPKATDAEEPLETEPLETRRQEPGDRPARPAGSDQPPAARPADRPAAARARQPGRRTNQHD